MTYRIAQSEKYVGNHYWDWSAWIEATAEELDQINLVTWILHPSFSPSRVETNDRLKNFRLDTSGWGTFMLRAELRLNGVSDTRIIRRMLRLYYPASEEVTSSEDSSMTTSDSSVLPMPKVIGDTVFLSYASEDERNAQAIGNALEEMGVRVLKANSISSDLPIEATIRKMIRESNAVVSVIGSDYASPYVLSESRAAQAEGKPLFTLLTEGVNLPGGLPNDAAMLKLRSDSGSLKSQLVGLVGKLREDGQETSLEGDAVAAIGKSMAKEGW